LGVKGSRFESRHPDQFHTLPKDALTKALKASFEAAHQAGQRALKRRDFVGVAKAVERERKLIEQQRLRLEKTRAARRRGGKAKA